MRSFFFWLSLLIPCITFSQNITIRGWNILSDSFADDTITINAAPSYNINHLQLSHDLVMDLREVRDQERRQLVNRITSIAHSKGIKEVIAWDHSLYDLSYYPERFKTGENGTINFDDPEFWKWFKQDYRQMLDLVPEIDGLVLTFIETGARAENQYSEKLKTGSEKIAAVVDAIADIVCEERGKKLYIRTFAYTDAEYKNIIGCIDLIRSNKIILMMKETPHDFFLTHPNDKYAGTINRPTIMEFDTGNEFNGQGIISNTWPEYIIKRWSELIKKPNIIGYVARTDRYHDTRIVGTPNEILLYALKRYTEDQKVTSERIYDEFISAKYGKASLKYLKPAFMKAFDIVTCSFYTLGTNISNHSKMDFDPYKSSYGRHVSGKWLDPPVVFIKHGVNKEFHYWKDIIEHLSPATLKRKDGPLKMEAPFVIEQAWVTASEKMNETFLRYIITEKKYGVSEAAKALDLIIKAKNVIAENDYIQIHDLFYRTWLTARAYEVTASAYFGYRVYAQGPEYRSKWLITTMKEELDKMPSLALEIDNFKEKVPRGQWNWRGDAATLREYHKMITETGWKDYGKIVFKP